MPTSLTFLNPVAPTMQHPVTDALVTCWSWSNEPALWKSASLHPDRFTTIPKHAGLTGRSKGLHDPFSKKDHRHVNLRHQDA